MKYLNTNYKMFLESNQDEDHVNKYEIVEFKESFKIENVYGIKNNISINVVKGEKVKLYFNVNESSEDKYCIIGIRPIESLHKENKSPEKTEFSLSELWEGNFVLDTPMVIDKSTSPFKLQKYL